MKIRIGFGLGRESQCHSRQKLGTLVDALEERRFDSLWFSERIGSNAPDPVAAMGFAVSRTEHLKVGMSVMVLPGRNLAVLAQELATLDQLAAGRNRVLPAFGTGAPEQVEHSAFGVTASGRAEMYEEALPLLRRLWSEDDVSFAGRHYQLEHVSVNPKPLNRGFDVWMGGMGPRELQRIGRLSDGWLASFCTPADIRECLPVIKAAAADAGRTIDPEHFGAPIVYRRSGPLVGPLAHRVARRNPGCDPSRIVPPGLDGVVAQIEGLIAEGISKFVVLPMHEYSDDRDLQCDLDDIVNKVLPLQT